MHINFGWLHYSKTFSKRQYEMQICQMRVKSNTSVDKDMLDRRRCRSIQEGYISGCCVDHRTILDTIALICRFIAFDICQNFIQLIKKFVWIFFWEAHWWLDLKDVTMRTISTQQNKRLLHSIQKLRKQQWQKISFPLADHNLYDTEVFWWSLVLMTITKDNKWEALKRFQNSEVCKWLYDSWYLNICPDSNVGSCGSVASVHQTSEIVTN